MPLERNNSVISTISNVSVTPSVTPSTVDYNISQITPYLFITAEDTARQFTKVFSSGIGCVINVAHELPQIVFPPQSGIESLKYPIQDNPTFPVLQYFDLIADRIAANAALNRRTLLYCYHGRSRSVTFILAYLIKYHRLPLQTAYAFVKEKRQVASPNSGFWSQLQSYELQQQRLQQQQQLQQLQQLQQQQQLQQLQQQQRAPAVFRGYQDSFAYDQQVMYTLTDGFGRVIGQIPIPNIFTNTMPTTYQKSTPELHRHDIRRRSSVYSRQYYPQNLSRIYNRAVF